MTVLQSGHTKWNVYHSGYAGANQAPAVTWTVGDELVGIMRELKSKGVTLEQYDMPDITVKGDVHVARDRKIA